MWDSLKLKRCSDNVVLDDASILAFDPITHESLGLEGKVIYTSGDFTEETENGECYIITSIHTTGGTRYTGPTYESCSVCLAYHQSIQITACPVGDLEAELINFWMLVHDWQSAPIYADKIFRIADACYYIDAGSPRTLTRPDNVITPDMIDALESGGPAVFDDCEACNTLDPCHVLIVGSFYGILDVEFDFVWTKGSHDIGGVGTVSGHFSGQVQRGDITAFSRFWAYYPYITTDPDTGDITNTTVIPTTAIDDGLGMPGGDRARAISCSVRCRIIRQCGLWFVSKHRI